MVPGPNCLASNTPKHYIKYSETEEAKRWWKSQHFDHKEIMLKGSRGIGLEKIILDTE